MAKKTDRIWDWTQSGTSYVEHRGKTLNIQIPDWMQGNLENQPEEFLHQITNQLGARTVAAKLLQQLIIDLRSDIRPNDSKEKPVEMMQSDADTAKNWQGPEVKPPKAKAKDPADMSPDELVEHLRSAGWSDEALASLNKG